MEDKFVSSPNSIDVQQEGLVPVSSKLAWLALSEMYSSLSLQKLTVCLMGVLWFSYVGGFFCAFFFFVKDDVIDGISQLYFVVFRLLHLTYLYIYFENKLLEIL